MKAFISILFILAISAIVQTPTTIRVSATGDLQAAIDTAKLGDTIIVEAGAIFSPVALPNKTGTGEILIQSSRAAELPEGVRVSPSQSSLMARIQSATVDPALFTKASAHGYRFVGIEFTTTADNSFGVVRLGESQQALAEVPRDLFFDRCYVHGQPTLNVQRGVTLNSGSTTIVNSYVSEIHWVGVEAQAVGGWNGPGPFLIQNNYLEAAGINVLFGGAQPSIIGLVPSDIQIKGNTLFKPLRWRVGDPSYAGIHWTVKNLLEFKNCRRCTVADNVMENSWADSQSGWGVIFNTSTEDSGAWNVVEDIKLTRNQILKCANGLDIAGGNVLSGESTAVKAKRIEVSDNRIESGFWNGEGKALLVLQGTEDVTIDHNTLVGINSFLGLSSAKTLRHTRLIVRNNLSTHGTYGVFGDGGFIGTTALNQYATDWIFTKNALYAMPADVSASQYPANNYFPDTLAASVGLLGSDGLPVGARSVVTSPGPTPSPVTTPTPTVTPTPAPSATPKPSPSPIPTPKGKPCKIWPPWKMLNCL